MAWQLASPGYSGIALIKKTALFEENCNLGMAFALNTITDQLLTSTG